MPKKGKVGLISTVKPFYDKIKLTAKILLAKDLREQIPLLVGIYLPFKTDKSRQYSQNICGEVMLPLIAASISLFKKQNP